MTRQVIDVVARDKTKGTLRGIETSLGKIATLAAGAFGIAALNRYANTVQEVNNRLKLVTTSQDNLNKTFNTLQQVANRSRGDLEGVVDLYSKIALSTKDLGISQATTARITETFAKSLAISGASAQGSAGAIRQFGQALASGAFRGDEFNSVVEAAPIILDILAKETGKARGEIRALASEGKLTSDVLINALLKSSKDIDDQFAKTSVTIGQATTTLQNNFLALGRSASPVFTAIGEGILFVANNLENAIVFAGSFAAALAVGKVIAMTRAVGGLTLGVRALTAAIAANPIGLIAVAFATAATAAYTLLKPILELQGALGTKLLFALEKATNAFFGFFKGVGNAAYEFGKLFVAAINPFDDLSVFDVYDQFGSRLKSAFKKGFEDVQFEFISDEDRAKLDKQLNDAKKALQEGLDEDPITIEPKVDPKKAEEALKNITALNRDLFTELEKINAKYEERKKVLAAATDEQIATLNTTRADLERKIEEDLAKDLKSIRDRSLQEEKDRRDQQINAALKYADDSKRIEFERVQAIKEINALNEDALKEVGISRIEAINKVNSEAARKTLETQKRQVEDAKKRKKEEEIAILKSQGRTQDEAEKYYAFERSSQLDKTKFALSQGKTILEGLGQYSEKAFKAAKAFAIAEAVINTYQGATKALASYPPPFNFIAAAAVVASGLAQVATIRSQQPVGRQRGGDLRAGQTALVGEGGAELIVPKAPSTVIPNEVATALENMGGRRETVQVVFNIQANDTRGFDDLITSRRGLIVNLINSALNEKGRSGVTA